MKLEGCMIKSLCLKCYCKKTWAVVFTKLKSSVSATFNQSQHHFLSFHFSNDDGKRR